jgi:hypothetical protein
MKPFHFFASSLGEWQIGDDLEVLIKGMKRNNLDFTLWKLPLDKSENYEIRSYVPVVVGRVYLGMFKHNGKMWEQSCLERKIDEKE